MKKMICFGLSGIMIAAISLFFYSNGLAAPQVVVIPLGGVVGDATPPDVLEGKTFSSRAGKGLTGTLLPEGITHEVDPTVAASVKDGVSWGEVADIPAGFVDGTDNTGITTESDPTVAASVKDGVSWGEVAGIPAGFADGIDNNSGGDITGVTAGTGLSGGGTSGNVTLNVVDRYVNTTGDTMSGTVSGGLLTATNSSSAGSGFAGYCYASNGSGVFGQGALNGIYGYSNSTGNVRGVYGVAANTGSYTNYGGYFTAAGTGGRAVYGGGATGGYFVSNGATGRGVYAYASGTNGHGIYAVSSNGDGIYGGTGASDEHAGYFSSSVSAGLAGAALYARASNSTVDGIALWAHNDHTTSTDATLISSNDGSGPLFKGFGGDGGNDEFRIDNNGSIHVYDPTIADDVLYFSATSGYLYLGSGSSTTPGDDGDLIILDDDGSYAITLDGASGRTTTRSLQITGGSDLSEHFDIDKHLNTEPGMLVSIDPENPGKLSVSREPYDRKVAGIISGAGGIKTGLMMGQHESIADGAHPVALTGRVYCMADTSQGTIEPGDLLTSSTTPGHAMKVTDHSRAVGAIIGKAMTPLTEGEGLVLVLVALQ